MSFLKIQNMKLPDFIVIGETKCGTSSFFEDLVKHPNINPSKPIDCKADYMGGKLSLDQKEIRFFDRHWAKGFDWYKNRFIDELDIITGEASPTYMYRALAMKRISQYLPNIKLIIMLRNPIDRLYSHFHHIGGIVPKWEIRYPTFETFLNKAHENDYYIIDKGIYINPVQRCFKQFQKDQIHIIRSEDFFKNPVDTYKKTIDFLGLIDFVPDKFSHLRKSGFKKSMRIKTRKDLLKFYSPYNEELYSLINRDMGWNN